MILFTLQVAEFRYGIVTVTCNGDSTHAELLIYIYIYIYIG